MFVVVGTSIENVYNFCDFYKALVLKSLWNLNFLELADNGLLSCIAVVVVYERKWGIPGP